MGFSLEKQGGMSSTRAQIFGLLYTSGFGSEDTSEEYASRFLSCRAL